MRDLSLEDFADRLASAEPTPGGGTASAVAGALAAALVAMVARTTIGKQKFADRQAAMETIRDEADALRRDLLVQAEADAKAFEAVLAAYRLPRGTPEEQARRGAAVQDATRGAIATPLAVGRLARRVLDLAGRVAAEGNPNAASDAGVGGLLAAAAMRGALLNVQINLAQLADAAERAQVEGQAAALRADLDAAEEAVRAAVAFRLS
ncbi:MAG TPA: cyclodeaminase/cyclohydrolase family protein [Candidatus Methylomirabilis sp.]